MTVLNAPRLGVMSHSFGKELFMGWSREQCFERVGALGGEQHIELIGGQLIRSYPALTVDEERAVRHLIDDNHLRRSAYCAYVERGRKTGAVASDEDVLPLIREELHIAKRLGYGMVRVNPPTPWLVRNLLADLERLEIVLVAELHSERLESAPVQALLELLDKEPSHFFGLLQDTGAFTLKVPHVYIDYGIRSGIPERFVEIVINGWNDGKPFADTISELDSLGAAPSAIDYARICYSVYIRGSIENLRTVLPFIKHVHAKLYRVNELGDEPAIPYREIIEQLVAAGYTGCFSSEYGGGLFSPDADCFDQISLQQVMIKRIWQEAATRLRPGGS